MAVSLAEPDSVCQNVEFSLNAWATVNGQAAGNVNYHWYRLRDNVVYDLGMSGATLVPTDALDADRYFVVASSIGTCLANGEAMSDTVESVLYPVPTKLKPSDVVYTPGRMCSDDSASLEIRNSYKAAQIKSRWPQTLYYSIDNGANWQTSNVFKPLPDVDVYELMVKNQYGCLDANNRLDIKRAPQTIDAWLEAGPDDTIVAGQTFRVHGDTVAAPGTPHWTTSGTGTFANADTLHPVYIPSAADVVAGKVKLYLSVNSNNYCPLKDSLTLYILECGVYSIVRNGGDTVVACGDETLTLIGKLASDNAALIPPKADYEWRLIDIVFGSGYTVEHSDMNADSSRWEPTEPTPGLYELYVKTVSNCILTDTFYLDVQPIPTGEGTIELIYPGGKNAISMCINDTARIVVTDDSGLNTYTWPDGTESDGVSNNSYPVTATKDTSVIIKITSQGGCVGYDTIDIAVDKPFTLVLSGSDTTVCIGSDVRLPKISTAGYGSIAPLTYYQWTNIHGDTVDAGNYAVQNRPVMNITQDTVYHAYAYTDAHCQSAVSEYRITVDKYRLALDDTLYVCYGDKVKLSMPSATKQYVINGANFTAASAAAFEMETSPLYNDTVLIVTATDTLGCGNSDTVVVYVLPLPDMNIVNPGACANQPVVLRLPNLDATDECQWEVNTVSGKYNFTGDSINFRPGESDSVLFIDLKVTNRLGCVYTKKDTISVYTWPDLNLRDTTVCEGSEDIPMILKSDDVNALYKVTWLRIGLDSTTILPNAFNHVLAVADTASHRYYFSLKNRANGCMDTNSVMVNITRKPRLKHIEDDTICAVTSQMKFEYRQIGKYNAAQTQWSCVEYLANGTQSAGSLRYPNNTASLINVTYYPSYAMQTTGGVAHVKVYTQGTAECAATTVYDSFNIVFTDPLRIPVINPQYKCINSNDNVTVTVDMNIANMTGFEFFVDTTKGKVIQQWDTATKRYMLTYLNPGGDTNVIHRDSLRIWNKDNCELSRVFEVGFVGAPRVEPDTLVICPGDTVTVEVFNPNTTTKPNWTDLSTSKTVAVAKNEVRLSPTKTTSYKVSPLRSADSRCTGDLSDTVTIVVRDRILVETAGDTNVCEITDVKVGVTQVSQAVHRYQWIDSATGNVVSTDTAFMMKAVSSNHTFFLTVWNDSTGCIDHDTLHLTYGGNLYKLNFYDTTVYAGTEIDVVVSGPWPTEKDPACPYEWFDETDTVTICALDSIWHLQAAKTTDYTLYLRGGETECYNHLHVTVLRLNLHDTAVCDYCPTEIGIDSVEIDYVEWYYLDTLSFTSGHTDPIEMDFCFDDTVQNKHQVITDSLYYHAYVIPYPYKVKESDTVPAGPFCDTVYSEPRIELAYDGKRPAKHTDKTEDIDVYKEFLHWNKVEVLCKEPAPGKKFVCDTLFEVRTKTTAKGTTITRLDDGVLVNCREIDSVCVAVGTEDHLNFDKNYDTVTIKWDCTISEPPTEGTIKVCDTTYVLINVGTKLKPKYARDLNNVTVSNCREVSSDCKVTYTVNRAIDNSEEKVTAEIACSDTTSKPPTDPDPVVKTKTVCDTVYTLTNQGTKLKPNYVRGEAQTENCREVSADCEVKYETNRASDNSSETVKAVTSCSTVTPPTEPDPDPDPDPVVKTKTVCDTVYTLTNKGTKLKPNYVRGEAQTENCREVAESCVVTYEPERAADNSTETEKAVVTCN